MEQEQNTPDPGPQALNAGAERQQKLERDREQYRRRLASMSPSEFKVFRKKKLAAATKSYERRKPTVLAESRKRYAASLQFLPSEELEECKADPRKVWTIRGNDWIACLICGQLVQAILAHLQHSHPGWALEKYKNDFGYGGSKGLVSNALAAKMRANLEKRGVADLLAKARAACKNPPVHGRKGWRRSLVSRLNQSDTMRGIARPEFSEIDDAEFVRRFLLKGQAIEKYNDNLRLQRILGTRLNRKRPHLKKRANVWTKPKAMFAHGEPLTNRWFARLSKRFGDVKDWRLAQRFGLPGPYVWKLGRRVGEIFLTPEFAAKALDIEREGLKILTSGTGISRGSQPANLKAVIPDLNEKLGAATRAIELFGNFAEQSGSDQDRVLNELCADSRKDVAEARTILSWLRALLPWLERSRGKPRHGLAIKFLADDYGVKGWIIQKGLHAQASEPTIIRALIFASSPMPAPEQNKEKDRGGKKRGYVADETRDLILLAAALERLGVTKTYAMAPRLYRLGPRSREGAEAATRLLRRRHAVAIKKTLETIDVAKATEIAAMIHPKS